MEIKGIFDKDKIFEKEETNNTHLPLLGKGRFLVKDCTHSLRGDHL